MAEKGNLERVSAQFSDAFLVAASQSMIEHPESIPPEVLRIFGFENPTTQEQRKFVVDSLSRNSTIAKDNLPTRMFEQPTATSEQA